VSSSTIGGDDAARTVFDGERPGQPKDLRLPTLNRRGRTLDVRVTATPLRREDAGVTGAIVVVEEERRPESTS